MGDKDQNLEVNKKKQDVKLPELNVQAPQIQKNAGMPPVVNDNPEKLAGKNAAKKVPLFKEEELTVNAMVGSAILEYDKILLKDQQEKKATDVKYDTFDNMTMKEVLDAMETDTHVKHKEFAEMEEAFKALYYYGDN